MRPRIILIHGLNNKIEAFVPLRDKFNSMGYDCHILCLPGHGEDRSESRTLKSAFHHFDLSMKRLMQDPYVVVAFSQGALFLQLWLEKNIQPKPKAQLLLAPALYIRKFERLNKIVQTLPAFFRVLSVVPAPLRRYWYLHLWEYKTLFEAALKFSALRASHSVPTKILIDPRDEIVDAQKIHSLLGDKVEYFERSMSTKKRPGKHHILFHPDYFSPDEWDNFMKKIDEFFKKNL